MSVAKSRKSETICLGKVYTKSVAQVQPMSVAKVQQLSDKSLAKEKCRQSVANVPMWSVTKQNVAKVQQSIALIRKSCSALASLVVLLAFCCTATTQKLWLSPKMPKMRFSGHIKSRLLRTMANVTKQMAGPYTWGWTQQLHLVVNLTSFNIC